LNPLERIQAVQHQLQMNNRQMAGELRVSEFWYSKVVNGHRPASADLLLRLDDLQRRRDVVLGTNLPASPPKPGAKAEHVGESTAAYGTSGETAAEIHRHVDELIHYANGDPGRLGWIREQLLKHLQVPAHWNIHEQVIRKVQEQRRLRPAPPQSKPGEKSDRATG
jgi:hypothetical protein